jgi:hypothetical protein
MGRNCEKHGREQDACRILLVKPDRKSHFDDKVYVEGWSIVKQLVWDSVDWIYPAEDKEQWRAVVVKKN